MRYSFKLKVLGKVFCSVLKKDEKVKPVIKSVGKEYAEIMKRAKDIGDNNMLISAYSMAAFFIALNRKDGLPPEENYEIFENGLLNGSTIIRKSLGSGDTYFSPKKMEARYKWSEETHKHKYENDWEVDVLPGNGDFTMGFDYTQCGVCKLCRDEGCPELARYLCRLDFVLVEVIGVGLKRTTTLAEGYDKCDFRFYKKN